MRVHEEIGVDSHRVKRLKNKFIHFEYRSYDHFFSKRVKYTQLGAEDRWDNGERTSFFKLLISPLLRFMHLYFLRLGFLDGLPGLQVCVLTAFFNTFVKQGRLWEMNSAVSQDVTERAMVIGPRQPPLQVMSVEETLHPESEPEVYFHAAMPIEDTESLRAG